MKNYLDITVVISPGTNGAYAVRVESSQGGQGHSTLKLPFTLRDLSGAVFGVAQTTRDIGSSTAKEAAAGADGAKDTRTAADFGAELFEALFQNETRDVLAATDSRAQGSLDTGVRIRLSMDLQGPGMAEVASLPWELMCRRGQRALAVSIQTPLVRSLDAPRPIDPRPFRPPLRIMALMSNPSGTAALNLDTERVQIQQSWARLPGVAVDFVRPVRSEILKQLAAGDYHVIHYMGHGDFDAGEGGMLLLELEDGSPDRVTGDVFAAWLADEPLRLVFLNACKTGTTSVRNSVHPFAGVATALIRERVPAVVAMQFPISDQAAIAFAQTFYERIAQGFPVDAAVAEGRKVLYSGKQAEWATPVLYLRAKDGMLFGPASDDPPGAGAAAMSRAAQGLRAPTAPAAEDDPWGVVGGDVFRVFLATPDQNLETKHRQLSKTLKGLDWVRVVDSVPRDDRQQHDAAVDNLVRRADLSVHLLGAHPGQRLDDDDPPDTLKTYQLEQLSIGLKADRPQLVVMTSEDKDSIGNEQYAARLDELAKLPRDKARFELLITDKNRITEKVQAKLEELKKARQAPSPSNAAAGAGRTAFVDSHVDDQARAVDLVAYLLERNVDTNIRTSSATDFAQLDETVRKSSLYVVVAGIVDRTWVNNRRSAIMKAAVKSRKPVLIARYAATPTEGADRVEVTRSRFEFDGFNDSDQSWVDALFAPAAEDKA